MPKLSRTAMRGWIASLAGAAVAWTAIGPALAAPCFQRPEVESKQVRLLQTELMVAALTCRYQSALGFEQKYNGFVRKFDKRLSHHIGVLRTHFKREYGAGFERQYDRFSTDLANQVSQRTQGGGAYCADSAWLFDEVTDMPIKELESFAASIHLASIANANACEPVALALPRTQRAAIQPAQ
jgi:hypothetical protein